MSKAHNRHPIASQLHAPITADEHLFQLGIPALAFICQPAAASKEHVGEVLTANEQKFDVHMVSELQKFLLV